MGITFADIVEKSRDIRVQLGKGTMVVSYDPSALSPSKISKMQKELKNVDEDDEDAVLGVSKMFCNIVKGWDLVGPFGEDEEGNPLVAAGEPVPVSTENVSLFPAPIISGIIEQVTEDASPKRKK